MCCANCEFCLLILMAFMCSLYRTLNVRPVCPIYLCRHSLHCSRHIPLWWYLPLGSPLGFKWFNCTGSSVGSSSLRALCVDVHTQGKTLTPYAGGVNDMQAKGQIDNHINVLTYCKQGANTHATTVQTVILTYIVWIIGRRP
jgi:hypothetical protein